MIDVRPVVVPGDSPDRTLGGDPDLLVGPRLGARGKPCMRAYILSIGSELILGQLTDTNATYLAQELAAAGIDLIHVTHVGDDQKQLADAIRHALSLADVVICTGGI